MKKKTEPAAAPTATLFDRMEPQTISLKVPFKNQLVTVQHTLNFPSDARLIEFYKQRKVEQKLSKDGLESSDTISNACERLWDEIAESVSGYAKAERPDWKKVTPLAHKEGAIDQGLMMARVIAPEVLEADLLFDPEDSIEEIKLEILCGDRYVYPTAYFNRPNADQVRRYRRIRDSNVQREKDRLIETTSMNLVDRAALYEELIVEAKGWAGDVPITHKAVAVMGLFEKEIELVTKN